MHKQAARKIESGARRHRHMAHLGIAAGAQPAIADDDDVQAVPLGDALDLGLHRAGVAIDIDRQHVQ